jgi:hypothetical protein
VFFFLNYKRSHAYVLEGWLFFVVDFGGTRGVNSGHHACVLARQALYHLSHTSSPGLTLIASLPSFDVHNLGGFLFLAITHDLTKSLEIGMCLKLPLKYN